MDIEAAVNLKFTVVGNGRYKRTLEHDSLVLDTERNVYFWNSRNTGGDVADFLIKFCGVHPKIAWTMSDPATALYERKEVSLKKNIHEILWQNGKNHREYWYSRGYEDWIIDKYKLGYLTKNYTLPCVMEGELKAVMLKNENFVSYLEGSSLSLFGLDIALSVADKPLLLVESSLDVPILDQHGFRAVGRIYGNQAWDHAWNKYFLKEQVIIIPDNDSAGYGILSKIKFHAKVVRWPKEVPKGFDINKLYLRNPEKFTSNVQWLIDNSVPIEFMRQG